MSDQLSAMIELKKIDAGDEVMVSFSVEESQNRPFEVHFLNLTHERPVKERAIP